MGRPPKNGIPHRVIAEALGVSLHAVGKAVLSGRLRPDQSGLLTVESARRQYEASRNPDDARQPAQVLPESTSAADLPFPEEEEGDDLADLAAMPTGSFPPGASFAQIKIAHETVKVRERALRVQERERQLVDRARAAALVQAFAQEERDAVLSLPSRVSGVLAAQLGCDPHALQTGLEAALRSHLAERGGTAPRVA